MFLHETVPHFYEIFVLLFEYYLHSEINISNNKTKIS